MRFSHPILALVSSGLASAQLPDIPSCSLNCFVNALGSDGCSQLTDFACHCQKPQLVSKISPCVQKACKAADQSSVSNVVVSQCSQAGHPISVPPVTDTDPGAATTSNVERSQVVITSPASSSSSSVRQTCRPISDGEDGDGGGGGGGGGDPRTSSSLIPSSSDGAVPPPSSSSGPVSSSASLTPGPPVFTGAAGCVRGGVAGVAGVAAVVGFVV